jgi:hypothetical protein
MKQGLVLFLLAGLAATNLVGPAAAAPRYATTYANHYDVPPPYPAYYGAPVVGFVFMRHTSRCEYPRGFNQTDFVRGINGIPREGGKLIAEGCGTPDLFGR